MSIFANPLFVEFIVCEPNQSKILPIKGRNSMVQRTGKGSFTQSEIERENDTALRWTRKTYNMLFVLVAFKDK